MLLVCLCLAAIARSASSFPDGAPENACAGMTPNHGFNPSSLDPANPEFGITVSNTTYAANDVIDVTISGTTSFRGFLIIASTADGTPVGSFAPRGSTAAAHVQKLCGDNNNNGLTHTQAFRDNQLQAANAQPDVELEWTAPAAIAGHLIFYATIVKQRDTFYVRVPSDTISDGSPPPTTPVAPVLPPVLTSPIEFSECGKTKSCWTDDACSDSECDFLISWKKLSDTELEFEILTAGAGNNKYAAIGFAASALMKDVSVAACSVSLSGTASMREYLAPNKGIGVVSHATTTVNSGTATLSGTTLGCRFTYNNEQATQGNVFKNLKSTWRLMVARGSSTANTILQHTDIPIVSPENFNFDFFSTNYELYSGAAVNISPKAHGCLMVIAWCICVPIAIILARYYKIMWPEKKLCGEKVWFALHRALNLTAVLLTLIAFIVILVDKKGSTFTSARKAHPIIGTIVVFLSLVNPLISLFRCHPGEPKRCIFNIAHGTIGTICFSLSLSAMVLGTQFSSSLNVPGWLWIPTVVYACWYAVQAAIYEIHRCVIGYDKEKKPEEADPTDVELKPSGSAHSPAKPAWRYPGHMFRVVMLGVSVFIAAGYGIFLIIMIAI